MREHSWPYRGEHSSRGARRHGAGGGGCWPIWLVLAVVVVIVIVVLASHG